MTEFRRILCPIDFSEFSRHAIDHALALAQWYGGSVTALHVVTPVPYADPLMAAAVVFTPDDVDRLRRELSAFVTEECGTTPVEAKVVEWGAAAPAIVAEAEAMSADLLVLGTHGRSGFERFVLGSVTERVVRKVACPVLTVPTAMPDAVPIGPLAFARILCAVDFSPASTKALALARSMAKKAHAELTVMHVVEPVLQFEPIVAGSTSWLDLDETARQAMAARMHAAVAEGDPVTEVVVTGKPYREILRQAVDGQADLLVMGTHAGKAGLFGFGSTTNRVVREATCPVLSLGA